MSPATQINSTGLSRRSRFLAAVVGTGLLSVLLLASQLRPDPRGWGTHEQLGLPPCTFLSMTTAWAQVTHGRPLDALQTHATGSLLALGTLATGLTAVVVAARGKPLRWQPGEKSIAVTAVLLAGAVFVEWIVRVWI